MRERPQLPSVTPAGTTATSSSICSTAPQSLHEPVTLIARLCLEAVLYASAPPRQPSETGRPALKGPRRSSLKTLPDQADAPWTVAAVAWYDGATRTVKLTSEPAVWYRSRKPAPTIRWVLVRDPQGTIAPQVLLCTDPTHILQWFVLRWSASGGEVTLQEARTHLGMEAQHQWSDLAIARTTPILLGLFSWITLATRAGSGASIATLRLTTSAMSKAHEWTKLESPCRDLGVRPSLKGWGRRLAKPQRQSGALTADVPAVIHLTAIQPRKRGRGFETPEQTSERARFDAALVAVLSDAGLRRSGASSLTWGDVQRWDDGSGRITVIRSKTDVEPQGATAAITPAAMKALDAIRPAGVGGGERVFGLMEWPRILLPHWPDNDVDESRR